MKKITIHSEIAYFAAILLIAFAVALTCAADFGVSTIVAPALILSLKFNFLTFGQWEYVVQAVVFVLLCIVIKKFRFIFLQSFLTGILYGFALDLFRLIPFLSQENAGTAPIPLRILFFVAGLLLTAFSVALFFQSYFYPQVPDYFVKAVTTTYPVSLTKFKIGFDISYFAVALILSLVFFGGIRGIGIGTVIIACVSGFLIGFFSKMFDKYCTIKSLFPKLRDYFDGVKKDSGDSKIN